MHGLPHHALLPPFGAQAFEQIDHPQNPLGHAAVGKALGQRMAGGRCMLAGFDQEADAFQWRWACGGWLVPHGL